MFPAVLLPHKITRSASKGQQLFVHGDAATQLWFVTAGWVKLSRTSPEGKETVLGLCSAGDAFGEAVLVNQSLYPYSAEVVSPAQLVTVPRAALLQEIQRAPDLAMLLLGRLHDRMRQHQRLLDQMQSLTAAQRVGCLLLRLCDQTPDGGPVDGGRRLTLPLDKQVLAASLSMKPETFSRALQQLRDITVETQGEAITIAALDDLRRYVCEACSESGLCGTPEGPRGRT